VEQDGELNSCLQPLTRSQSLLERVVPAAWQMERRRVREVIPRYHILLAASHTCSAQMGEAQGGIQATPMVALEDKDSLVAVAAAVAVTRAPAEAQEQL
jgi:hypothetical protein